MGAGDADARGSVAGAAGGNGRIGSKFAANRDGLRRFENEAKAAGGLEHPNLAAVTDVGQAADGAPYLVMEFLEGEDGAAASTSAAATPPAAPPTPPPAAVAPAPAPAAASAPAGAPATVEKTPSGRSEHRPNKREHARFPAPATAAPVVSAPPPPPPPPKAAPIQERPRAGHPIDIERDNPYGQ